MIRMNRRSFVAGAAGVAATSFVPATIFGQEDSSELLSQVPGLDSAYARRYNPADDHAHFDLGDAEVEVTDETPHHLVINALVFESAAALQGVLGFMLSPATAAQLLSEPDADLTEEPAGGFPRGSMFYYGADDDGEYMSLLVVPVDNIGFAISTKGETDAVQATADAIAAFLVEQEPSDTPVVVESEGVATGGVFNVFPGVDDLELLNGLIPMFDYDLLISEHPILPTNATPAASPAS